jgi:hypothetical protein
VTSPNLHTIFHERQEYLLTELRVIDIALGCAEQNGEAADWISRLKKWRADVQKHVEDMPQP